MCYQADQSCHYCSQWYQRVIQQPTTPTIYHSDPIAEAPVIYSGAVFLPWMDQYFNTQPHDAAMGIKQLLQAISPFICYCKNTNIANQSTRRKPGWGMKKKTKAAYVANTQMILNGHWIFIVFGILIISSLIIENSSLLLSLLLIFIVVSCVQKSLSSSIIVIAAIADFLAGNAFLVQTATYHLVSIENGAQVPCVRISLQDEGLYKRDECLLWMWPFL